MRFWTKNSQRPTWFKEPHVGLRKSALLAVACFGVLTALRQNDLLRRLADESAEVVVFSARTVLGQVPPLSSQLKLVVFDDKTMATRKAAHLSGDEWAKLIQTLAAEHPAAIVIDQVFGVPFSKAEVAAITIAAASGVPVIAGSFQSPAILPGREALIPRAEHHEAEIIKDPEAQPKWLRFDAAPIYGPDPSLEPAFAHVGHLMLDGYKVHPFLGSAPDTLVPLAPFYVGGGVAITKDGLFVNWRSVPVDADGKITPNFRGFSAFANNILTVQRVISDSTHGKLAEHVKGGDVIFVIPEFFTGSTDFKDTPVGTEAGGLVMAALINSVMTGDWLTPMGRDWPFALFGAALGVLIAMTLSNFRFWLTLLASVLGLAALGIAAFVYQGLIVPWHVAMVSTGVTACILAAEKLRIAELKAQALRAAFAKMMAPHALKKLMLDPGSVELEPAQRVVTILFIDIVGFSLRSEEQEAAVVFRDLKEQIGVMTTSVHAHGGVVDKTLGDGILAFFGYRYDGSPTDPDHADRAVRCAIDIQRRMMVRNHESAAKGQGVSPVRIGINSEAVFIGNLGDQDRLDFTLIGHGVNFAKRLEEACEIYRIMLSETTHRMLLTAVVSKDRLRQRMIMVKHHAAPLSALELDPFFDDPKTLAVGLEEYRVSIGVKKAEERVEVPRHFSLRFQSKYGAGEVADLSLSGLSVKLATYLARGMEIEFHLDSEDGSLARELAAAQLSPLVGQVRWGAPAGDSFMHGVVIKNLSQVQKAALFRIVTSETHGVKLSAA